MTTQTISVLGSVTERRQIANRTRKWLNAYSKAVSSKEAYNSVGDVNHVERVEALRIALAHLKYLLALENAGNEVRE